MHERLSFYVKGNSAIHRLNPLTKLVTVLGLILTAFISSFYWTPLLLILFVIFPLVAIAGVMGAYVRAAFRLILPAVGFLFIMQSLFHPTDGEALFQIWFLHPTRESIMFAFGNATRIFLMISAFTLLLLTTHPSELMADLTRRGVPGQFAYVIISTLQILPQMQAKAQTIAAAQRSRGLDTESTFFKRAGSLLPLIGPLVFGSLVEVEERAIAIEARGFTSTHVKTSLHDVPDSRHDKVIRWFIVLLVAFILALRIWQS